MLRRNISSISPKVWHRVLSCSVCASVSARYHSTSNTTSASGNGAVYTSPHQCSIERVLMSGTQSCGNGIRTDTLRGIVQLLIDPNASDVEDVSLVDFVAMVPRRQLAALRGRREWLDVVLTSERYQVCKDTRALRLAGITTIGRWDENRERVPLSMYTRGMLEEAYATMSRHPSESQKDQVITWLTKAIQTAVIEEFAANKGNRKVLAPLITGMQAALPGGVTNVLGTVDEKSGDGVSQHVDAAMDTEGKEERVDATESKLSRSSKSRGKRYPRQPDAATERGLEDGEEDKLISATAVGGKSDRSSAAVHTGEDAEIQRLLEETEREFAPASYARGSKVLDLEVSSEDAKGDSTDPKSLKAKHKRRNNEDNAQKRHRHHGGDVEEGDEGADTAGASAAVTTPSNKKERESLARLTALMLHQFSSADGYLHLQDIREDEKRGFVIPIDEETSQVDPFALYSAFSSTTVSRSDSPEIAALKQVWAAYNAYAEAREASTADVASVRFYKEKGVEALIHAAVLLRAISRGHPVTVDARDVPPFGFPLLSSDRRPYRSRRGKGVTDMTVEKVDEAVKAFTMFFASKKCRFTPIRPSIDFNSGCSVIALMGTTLHLYETSLKSSVREEDIRCRFAEAMLGVLHVLDQQILTRVNVVHYHILATSISGDGTNQASAMSNANTSIVSIDTKGPFTVAEKKRLHQLAEPLGLENAIVQCKSVSSLVEAIEEFDVSVVHDILTNRDDLEALLTPTLVQLLPEADDDDDFDQTEELRPPTRRGAAPRDPSAKSDACQVAQGVNDATEEIEVDDESEARVVVKSGKTGRSRSSPPKPAASEEVGEDDIEERVAESGEVGGVGAEYEEVEEEQLIKEVEFQEAKGKLQPPSSADAGARRGVPSTTRGRDLRERPTPVGLEHTNLKSTIYRPDTQPERRFASEAMRGTPPIETTPPGSRRGYITRRPMPPAVDLRVDVAEEEEEAIRRPVRRSPPTRRPPPPPPPPTAPRSSVEVPVEVVGCDDDEVEGAMAPRPRIRSTTGVRRMGRAPMPDSCDTIGDADRWFERVRR